MVQDLVKEGAVEALRKCFAARMEFGTAGLRAAMGAGVSCMNDLTIIQTTQVRQQIRCCWSHVQSQTSIIQSCPPLFDLSRRWRVTAPLYMQLSEPAESQRSNVVGGGVVSVACPLQQLHFLLLHLFVLPDRVSVATWRRVLGALKSEG